jgi:hypothetical protein
VIAAGAEAPEVVVPEEEAPGVVPEEQELPEEALAGTREDGSGSGTP